MTLLFPFVVSLCYSQRNIETIAGNGIPSFGQEGEEIPAISPITPFDIVIDKAGNIYFSETSGYKVRKIDHITGYITTVAGNGTSGFSGDGGPAIAAQFNEPRGIAIDSLGNLFVCDYWNNRIRKIEAITGIVTTVVGNGKQDFTGDGGLAINASIFNPNDVAIDNSGNLYIADLNNVCIRKVQISTGVISTVAGVGQSFGNSGDGSLATSALIASPFSVAVDKKNNIYIADWFNNRIRKVTYSTGLMSTIAGTGEPGNKGDGGLAINAQLYGPQTVEVDAFGNVYISEGVNSFVNAKIRRINPETEIISSIIGNGTVGYSGDGGNAADAEISGPDHLIIDNEGNILLADLGNYRIRKITSYPSRAPEIIYSDSCLSNNIPFHINSEFPVFNVKWNFDDTESSSNVSHELSPFHKFSKENIYLVKAIVESDLGRDSLGILVNIKDCTCRIEIPNIFTPNNDGYNDHYSIFASCLPEFYKLSIINRWGQEVFHSEDINSTWDGTQYDREYSSGIYFFSISYKFSGDEMMMKKGTLTLLR